MIENDGKAAEQEASPPFAIKTSRDRLWFLFRAYGAMRGAMSRFYQGGMSGLRQLREAHRGRRDNIYRPVFIRHLWGRRPWVMLLLVLLGFLLISSLLILIANFWVLRVNRTVPSSTNPLFYLLGMRTINSITAIVFPYALLAYLAGFRVRALLQSPFHHNHLLTIPEARPLIFNALAVHIFRLAFASALILFLASRIYQIASTYYFYSIYNMDLSLFQRLMLSAGIPNAAPYVPLLYQLLMGGLGISLTTVEAVKVLAGNTCLILLLIVIIVRVRQAPQAVIYSVLFILGVSLLSFLLRMGLNSIYTSILFLNNSYGTQLNQSITQLGRLFISAAFAAFYLLLLGNCWRFFHERYCRRPLPIECDEPA